MRNIRCSIAKGSVLASIAISAAVPACKDDDGKGECDGGPARSGGAGGTMQGSGGRAGSGGTSTGGSKGGGPATGGGGGGGAMLDGGNDASSDAGSGDASVDAARGNDGAADGAADAADSAVSKCPSNPAFPVGIYTLRGITGHAVTDDQAGYTTSCVLLRETATLAIVASAGTVSPVEYDLDVHFAPTSAANPVASDFFFALPTVAGGKTHFHETGLSEPFQTVDFTIDNVSRLIESFTFTESHSGGFMTYDNALNAVGWPKCAATDASPPGGLPVPPVPTTCNAEGVTTPGCVWSFTPDSTPTCPSEPSGCSCKLDSDGYEERCCTP